MNSQPLTAIVIGAGIAGCSTAYALAKRGVSVTLIERHQEIAQEGSGNPVGMLYPKFSTGMNLQSTIASHGFAFTLALLKQLPNHHEIHDICGQIQLAFNDREQLKQEKLVNDNQHIKYLSASEASEIANIQLHHGGIYLPESGWVKPKAFCQALIQSKQIKKLKAHQAINIKKTNQIWQVALNKEQTLEANSVIVCNANELHQFTQCQHIPTTPVRGQVNFFKATDMSREIKPVICSDHYLSPAVDGFHSIGTSYAANDLNPALSDLDTQDNLLALKKISSTLHSNIQNENMTGRVAWRSTTRDYLPLAGQLIDATALIKAPPRYNDNPRDLPWLDGLYVNAGHGSKGMITAPMCGELIANQITNTALGINQSIAAKLNPSRFLLRDLGLKQIAQNLYPI